MYKGRRFYFSAPEEKIHTYHKAFQKFRKWQVEVDREIEQARLTTPHTPAWINKIEHVMFLQERLAEWGDTERNRLVWRVLEDYKRRRSLAWQTGRPPPMRDLTHSARTVADKHGTSGDSEVVSITSGHSRWS